MSEREDLTRWNRAGLNRFDYVDGNAVEFLEVLRQRLVRAFADPQSEQCDWIDPPQEQPSKEAAPQNESLVERRLRLSLREQRLLKTYQQERRDWAWEITRTFARSCHMLAEYSNAYANEAYLGTATQWEHVRRLVELLDYHPAPPASATTWLSLQLKPGASALISKGFQVKNAPPQGAEKVIFESLDDVQVDSLANVLRPKDWNISQAPLFANDAGNSGGSISELMTKPAIWLQGVGPEYSNRLNTLVGPGQVYRIQDFLTIAAEGAGITPVRLTEWLAKARFLNQLQVPGNWDSLAATELAAIGQLSAQVISSASGNAIAMADALKQAVAMVEVCIDHEYFQQLTLQQVLALNPQNTDEKSILWLAPKKPAVEPGQIALLMDTENDRAEAAIIARIEEVDIQPPALDLKLKPSLLQNSWGNWKKGQTHLHYASKWKRTAWLNGSDVIRTEKPHGLTADNYVAWKKSGQWCYAKIIEADKRNLRLETDFPLPQNGKALYQLSPIAGKQAAANQDVIVMLGNQGRPDEQAPAEMATPPLPSLPSLSDIFEVRNVANSPSISLPPLLPPGALPGIGSFLFPTPFLPVDLVKAAVELMLNLGVMQIPSTGEFVIKGLPFEGIFEGLTSLDGSGQILFNMLNELEVPDGGGDLIDWKVSEAIAPVKLEEYLKNNLKEDTPFFQEIKSDLEKMGPLLSKAKNATPIAQVINPEPLYMFDRSADQIQEEDWIVAEFKKGLCAAKIKNIESFVADDNSEYFGIYFDSLPSQPGELVKIYADFRGALQPFAANENLEPIDPNNFELDAVPPNLKRGQRLLVTGCGEPYLVKVTEVDGNKIQCEPPLRECIAGKMQLLGNIVQVGHGESKGQKILGSGDAAQSNQSFILQVADISFIPDATKNAGVAAAIDVEVDGRIWEQVSSLRNSAADDHNYEVRMTEAGFIKIIFGNGRNGRRLPSGKNNIRVHYRVGNGSAGNVPNDSLLKMAKPNPLVEKVLHPVGASGGGGMEDIESLRSNAPPTTLALKRAVSLSDFSHLAASQSSIWQARAYKEVLHGGKFTQITVYVVPADGVFSPDIKNQLESYLQNQAAPGVRVTVKSYVAQSVQLNIIVRLNYSAFFPDDVAAEVEAALIEQLALKNRKLGAPFYLSEVYRIIEGIQGVENSICELNGGLRVVKPQGPDSVIYLDASVAQNLQISPEEFRP